MVKQKTMMEAHYEIDTSKKLSGVNRLLDDLSWLGHMIDYSPSGTSGTTHNHRLSRKADSLRSDIIKTMKKNGFVYKNDKLRFGG